MQELTKAQLKKEILGWFIEGVAMYVGISAAVSLLLLGIYTGGGYVNLGPEPVLTFFKAWGLLTVAFIGVIFAFRVFIFLVEVVLFMIFAIGYVSWKGFKQWRENKKNSGGPGNSSGPPSLRDRWPGEPPHH